MLMLDGNAKLVNGCWHERSRFVTKPIVLNPEMLRNSFNVYSLILVQLWNSVDAAFDFCKCYSSMTIHENPEIA